MPWEPDWVIAPAETLQEWMDERGLDPRLLAAACGRVPVSLIDDVLKKKRLRKKHAEALARGTQIDAAFWLALEQNYRYGLAHGKKEL